MSERIRMRALCRQLYDGRPLIKGDPFDVDPEEVTDLEVLGLAARSQNDAPPQPTNEGKRRYQRRDLLPKP